MSTLLSNKNRKRLNQVEQGFEFGGHEKERKRRRKGRSGFIKDVSLLSYGISLEEGLQASTRVVEEEGVNCGGRLNNEQC